MLLCYYFYVRKLKQITVHSSALNKRGRITLYLFCLGFLCIYFSTEAIASRLTTEYRARVTQKWTDRDGQLLTSATNEKGYFASGGAVIPLRLEELLLKKEDRFFYYHLGSNPLSILRATFTSLRTGKVSGGSTITQQLVKILLSNENERTGGNKLRESLYALALELHTSKREILTMYEQSVYFGKNRQGVAEASAFYFGKIPSELTEVEMLELVATLGSPSARYPGSSRNRALLRAVGKALESDVNFASSTMRTLSISGISPKTSFELKTLHLSCDPCDLTIDAKLTEKIRGALRERILSATDAHVKNGAIVVLKLPENEILAIVGSPDPGSLQSGAQINMALLPRPIGSASKPFIYLNAFKKGARPYTIVHDIEYSYRLGTGFAFYPKNFDGKFRGPVTLHNALSNSLNIPAVKTLEFVGLPSFYDFLERDLGFLSRQPLSHYELGIALGALEMDLLTLSHFFTVFPAQGVLKPLTLERSRQEDFQTPMEKKTRARRVADIGVTQLVTRILSDREMAVEQFGLRSNLTLPYKNYALKTGTSRDYHDSWTIGFTPDFLVGVWLGNSDNTPMRELTGQTGAGAVFEDVMTLMYASPYNKSTPLNFSRLTEFTNSGSIEYGLPGDDYTASRAIMSRTSLIQNPHDGDTIELAGGTIIPLKASEEVDWFIDGVFRAHSQEATFAPTRTGKFSIEARGSSASQTATIFLTTSE